MKFPVVCFPRYLFSLLSAMRLRKSVTVHIWTEKKNMKKNWATLSLSIVSMKSMRSVEHVSMMVLTVTVKCTARCWNLIYPNEKETDLSLSRCYLRNRLFLLLPKIEHTSSRCTRNRWAISSSLSKQEWCRVTQCLHRSRQVRHSCSTKDRHGRRLRRSTQRSDQSLYKIQFHATIHALQLNDLYSCCLSQLIVLIHALHRGRFTEGLEDITLSLLTYRSFVMNRFTDKLTPLTDRIFCLRSGSAADTQTIAQVVTYQLDYLSYVVAHCQTVSQSLCLYLEWRPMNQRSSKSQPIVSVGWSISIVMIVAGWDKKLEGQVRGLSSSSTLWINHFQPRSIRVHPVFYSFDNQFHWVVLVVPTFGVILTITFARTWADKSASISSWTFRWRFQWWLCSPGAHRQKRCWTCRSARSSRESLQASLIAKEHSNSFFSALSAIVLSFEREKDNYSSFHLCLLEITRKMERHLSFSYCSPDTSCNDMLRRMWHRTWIKHGGVSRITFVVVDGDHIRFDLLIDSSHGSSILLLSRLVSLRCDLGELIEHWRIIQTSSGVTRQSRSSRITFVLFQTTER